MDSETPTENLHYCYRHPNVETSLRCKKCDRYICTKCAKQTPVGYICPECLRAQEDKFYTGNFGDYLIAAAIALPLSLVSAWVFTFLIGNIGWFAWLIAFFLAPIVAGFIAEVVRRAVKRRRSRYLAHTVAGSLILSVLLFAFPLLLTLNLFGLVTPTILLVMGTGTIMARLR